MARERQRTRTTVSKTVEGRRKDSSTYDTIKQEPEVPVKGTDRMMEQKPAVVTVGGGLTIPIENMEYSFARIYVEVARPCPNTDKDIADTYYDTSDMVDGFIDEEVKKLEN